MGKTRVARPKRKFWWIVTQNEDGRPYLLTGSYDEEEARRKGIEMLGGLDFRLVQFPTTDQAKASAMLRGKRLESTHSVTQAARRQGHEKTVKRDVEKRRRTGRF